jgi:plastocyanin
MPHIACSLLLSAVFGTGEAGELWIEVRDSSNDAVASAVVEIVAADSSKVLPTFPATHYTMKQTGKAFEPFVLAVPVGAEVAFPNFDPFRHHVYSFSKPKPFELKLYGQGKIPRIVFDKPGPVALGCNIHDRMRGYIYVASSPYFGVTLMEGAAMIPDVVPGNYRATVWHPDLRTGIGTESQEFVMPETGTYRLKFRIALKPPVSQPPALDIDQATEY